MFGILIIVSLTRISNSIKIWSLKSNWSPVHAIIYTNLKDYPGHQMGSDFICVEKLPLKLMVPHEIIIDIIKL